jgi:hypothetical protein
VERLCLTLDLSIDGEERKGQEARLSA